MHHRQDTSLRRQEVEQCMAALPYDFRRFSLSDFIETLRVQRQSEIFLLPCPMPPDYSGMWLTSLTPAAQLIFFDRTLPPFHQVHVIFHELSHWLLGHTTTVIDPREVWEWLRQPARVPDVVEVIVEQLCGRSSLEATPEQQREDQAEMLALLLQESVRQAGRAPLLTTESVVHQARLEVFLQNL